MIPTTKILTAPIEEPQYANRTYKIAVADKQINGYADDLNAVIQAIYLMLNAERYQHIIYSWDYGVDLIDLYGKPMPYVMSEIERRIMEALTQDDRIEDVDNFKFERNGNQLHVTFDVVTIYGTVSAEKEVTT